MTKLFISYRSLDSAKVDTLVARLRSLIKPDGTALYELWQDKDSIPAGKDWWKAILKGINDCDVFVFMVSRESVQNINCRAELSYARRRNRPIIPLVLEGEFVFNPVTGKNDISFWEYVPDELDNTRLQFLFYEGVSFVNKLNQSVNEFQSLGLRDIAVPEPPDPRHNNDDTNDTTLIYDQACDYAYRLEFETAEKLFQRLLDWNDPLFFDDAHDWIGILRSYQQMLRLDEKVNLQYKIPSLWQDYISQFPKSFTPLFDPKNFNARFGTGAVQVHLADLNFATSSRPTSLIGHATITQRPPASTTVLPIPFEWISISSKGYSIAKYPITNFQYTKFVELNGYENRKWWTDVGWVAKLKGWYLDSNMKWVETNQPWTQPRYWTDPKWNRLEQPVVGVSWYEAEAFCNWLRELTGEQIMLADETQWQYAAQGNDGRIYPWGSDWDCNRCNNSVNPCKSSGISSVYQYEDYGASPFGIVDMVGNIWEWCLNPHKNKVGGFDTYTIRGGSWQYTDIKYFSCTNSFGTPPFNRTNDLGFRICRF